MVMRLKNNDLYISRKEERKRCAYIVPDDLSPKSRTATVLLSDFACDNGSATYWMQISL